MTYDPAGDGEGASAQALSRIRALITGDRALRPGMRLPTERSLAEHIGVSRRAVRRALDTLEIEGRIWRRQGSGTFVGRKPERWNERIVGIAARTDPAEVMEARLVLEPALAALAARRAEFGDATELQAILRRIAEGPDEDARDRADGALHHKIAQMSGNAILLAAFEVMERVREDPVWRSMRANARSPARERLYASQHAEIIIAIAARDPAGAERAMRTHLSALRDNVIGAAE
ncbi:FadR family transcriptional regulator [Paroceanicella profunda]|uniref:FadR family transcriptional regulator n=1 Tax=Paroceanicella profunda TaxID=2579971 RepID=A0A5B8FGG2_9RHOB|nr:FCD domain-containing protein [Paroceanicella profunda]QDL91191.1 FadR family transcriptional regulator [Paroceanicella profunda]